MLMMLLRSKCICVVPCTRLKITEQEIVDMKRNFRFWLLNQSAAYECNMYGSEEAGDAVL